MDTGRKAGRGGARDVEEQYGHGCPDWRYRNHVNAAAALRVSSEYAPARLCRDSACSLDGFVTVDTRRRSIVEGNGIERAACSTKPHRGCAGLAWRTQPSQEMGVVADHVPRH